MYTLCYYNIGNNACQGKKLPYQDLKIARGNYGKNFTSGIQNYKDE